MSNVVVSSSFVKPHFIDELGCEGLTLHEVARSIDIDFQGAKRKFERMVADNRLKTLWKVYSCAIDSGTYTERQVVSYHLATDTAKFFVAKWDSETGDAYCRFLIECEAVVEKVAADPLAVLRTMTAIQVQVLLEQVQAKEEAQAELKQVKQLVDDLCGMHELMTLTNALKHIGIKPKLGIAWLRDRGALTLGNLPTSHQMKTKNFEIKSRLGNDAKYHEQCFVTGEGLVWLKSLKWPTELLEAA